MIYDKRKPLAKKGGSDARTEYRLICQQFVKKHQMQ